MGTVFWITGLPGSGKTTISRLLYHRIKEDQPTLLLDGDVLRSVLGIEKNYTYLERKKIALIYCKICKMISEQKINVIIATISMFHDCHLWNRANLRRYYEIYIRVPNEVLIQRNQKNLFSGKASHVVGVDIPFEEPKEPHFIIDNNNETSLEDIGANLYNFCLEKIIPK
jgi:cytidine diphosphoramidate kinase